ncbi:hypothetical protein PAECIP111893_01510 [Paenibacillus plantiphilus]|uniref:HNH endonuclease n=1 Tax=Paenibacillus plantiphilus TaxID=2905650 RepID=A0ABM9C219_9BACL|nr:HNH endonuclease signature motif containing protein [Paenibacillus plantiphilus]CAH1200624.1 hypothetical protein PAECIP111893_01510 [Paenibacillus plantiphilus]
MKRILVIIMTLVLCLSISTSSFASESEVNTFNNESYQSTKSQVIRIYTNPSLKPHLIKREIVVNNSTSSIAPAAATDSYVDVMNYLDFKQGQSSITMSYKIVAVSGVAPDTLTIAQTAMYKNSRLGIPSTKTTLTATILKPNIKVGKTGLKSFSVSSSKFWYSSMNVTITQGRNVGTFYGQTKTFLANSKATLYPYYKDSTSGKVMTEPSTTTMSKTTSIKWEKADRAAYIKKYSELYPKNGYKWDDYDIHHIKPREYGGTNDFNNLIPVPRNFHVYTVNDWWRYY